METFLSIIDQANCNIIQVAMDNTTKNTAQKHFDCSWKIIALLLKVGGFYG
jgi:hypothetical protein